jgi:hypothetical protein
LNHGELEAFVTELEVIGKANNHETTGDDNSPNSQYRRELAFQVGQIVGYCNALGFNPWPKIKPFFENYSISVLPEYPAFEQLVVLAHMQATRAFESGQITDSQLYRFHDLVRKFNSVANAINSQIIYPVDPRYEEWKAKHALKPKVDRPGKPREPVVPPIMPIRSRIDVENALKEMHYFWQDHAIDLNPTGDFASLLFGFQMSSGFLGYMPPTGLTERLNGISLEDLPDQHLKFLEYVNKIYRLLQEVRDSGEPTERQISRMYRVTWRTKVFAHATIMEMRELADKKPRAQP